jgi:folate-binding protein YgfZ
MYILRSKVQVTDASDELPGWASADQAAATRSAVPWANPTAFELRTTAGLTTLALPGPRYVVVGPPAAVEATRVELLKGSVAADYDVWQWLTIRAGVPVITAATQDTSVAQTANWDALGGIDFQKGCYTGQEIIARTQYLGRLRSEASCSTPASRALAPASVSTARRSATRRAARRHAAHARRVEASTASRCCNRRGRARRRAVGQARWAAARVVAAALRAPCGGRAPRALAPCA